MSFKKFEEQEKKFRVQFTILYIVFFEKIEERKRLGKVSLREKN